MIQQSLPVDGIVVDSNAGIGVSGVSVEIWLARDDAEGPICAGLTDAEGRFAVGVPISGEDEVEEGVVRVEMRVLDNGDLLLAEMRDLRAYEGLQSVRIVVPRETVGDSRRRAATESGPGLLRVEGQVRGPLAVGAKIRIVRYSLLDDPFDRETSQETIAESSADESGWYRCILQRPIQAGNAAGTVFELQLSGPEEGPPLDAVPLDLARERNRIDLRMPDGHRGISEYELLDLRMRRELGTGPEYLDELAPEGLVELSNRIDIEPERLALLKRARELEAETGLPAPLFYGLGSSGLSLDLEDLIDVSVPELKATINATVDDGVVDERTLEGIDTSLAQLSERVLDRALAAGPRTVEAGLGEILACANLPSDVVRTVLARYQRRTGSVAEFWDSLVAGDGDQEAVDEGTRSELELAVDLSRLLGAESALIGRVLELRREGRWQALEDLAAFDFDDWCELIESLDARESAWAGEAADDARRESPGWVFDGTDAYRYTDVFGAHYEHHDPCLVNTMDASATTGNLADDPASEIDKFLYGTVGESCEDHPFLDDTEFEEEEYEAFRAPPGVGEDPEFVEEDLQDWVEIRAEAILDTLQEAFPSAFIRRELIQHQALGDDARVLLERLPKHDFLTRSIRERVAQDSELLESLDPSAVETAISEVEAVERLSRVTERPDEVLVLTRAGIRSAHAIATQPRGYFNDVFGEALGGRAQASRVHAQAQQVAAANTLAMVRLLQALQGMPLVLGGAVPPDRALKDIPDARILFGSLGFCGCEHCQSVYSPAAYFVDLLHNLDIHYAERVEALKLKLAKGGNAARPARKLRYKPLDVLLARRPDLADIPLTCENTLTPLPYIDLVTELLEARITGRSAAHDTGRTPADVLKAVPQHVDRDAYERLRQAVYPVAMPFHEPLAVTRAYLGHLGVQRRHLLESLARGSDGNDALLAEALDMAPEELAIVSSAPTELWRHVGFEAEHSGARAYTDELAQVPTFLRHLGIGFRDLIDLVSTRFVNPSDEIKLESSSADCDPDKTRIAGLDEQRLSRMVRLLRLQRRLGWSLLDLDRALVALGARDLDPPTLRKLVEIRDLSRMLDRPMVELLGLWASLDTFGKDNQFDRLLRTRAVAWRLADADAFLLREDRRELARTADSLDPVASALLAAFRMTSEELASARDLHARLTGAPARLDLAGISAVYRVILLARSLKLRIGQVDGLLRLLPPDVNPFRPAEPAATRRFVEVVHEVQASGFTPEQLVYLYNPTGSGRRDPAPTDAQVQSVLASIRRGLSDALAETARPAELTGEFLRQKLAMWLDPPLVDPAMEALDPRRRQPPEKRRQFFDRHLARIFPDAAASAAALFPAASPVASPAMTPPPVRPAEELEAALAPGSTPPQASTAAPVSPEERRWRANIERVVDHLLPMLRQKQMRGAVIQTLSDSLGLSNASTGQLVDGLLRSRRSPDRALIDDFFALLGTGLTGNYFANATLSGEPAVTRIDDKLELAWAGASPAPGVPGTGFSVRWTGRLLPRSKAPHTFFVNSDGGVRLSISAAGTEHVLLDEAGGSGIVAEYVSKGEPLDPTMLYELKIEYRNKGGPASVVVRYGTSPDSKQTIPTVDLFPADGLPSFEPVFLSYRRLHKAALLLTGLGIRDEHLGWLTGEPRYIRLDSLSMEPTQSEEAVASFQRWRQLAALYALRKRLPSSSTDLFEIFKARSLSEAIETLVRATGWERAVVEGFLGEKGFAVEHATLGLPVDTAREPFLLRLDRAIAIQRRAGVSPETLFAWAGATPDAEVAGAIVQAVKARYDEKRWLEVAERLNEALRLQRRDALLAYLLPRMRVEGIQTRGQLFEYFLIDVEMSPCMLTSRVKQAISAVQTFYQRCLMNLEAQVNPRLIDQEQWKWMKNYRVWEANRKVFLYAENWIEPELREDKTPEFKTLERTILQQEIKKEHVESAFIDYLQHLDEVSRLDVRAVWFQSREPRSRGPRKAQGRAPLPGVQWQDGSYHIFARTYNAPHKWFYRRLDRGRTWTPWEGVDADIEGDHLVPVMFQNRMYLFWTIFREKSKPAPEPKKDAAPFKLGKDWEIGLAYSCYDRGRWTRKQLSSGSVVDVVELKLHPIVITKGQVPSVEGSTWLPTSAYTLKAAAQNRAGRLRINLFRRAVDGLQAALPAASYQKSGARLLSDTDVELIAQFELVGCNGELAPVFLGSAVKVDVGRSLTVFGRRRGHARVQPSRLPMPTRLPPFRFNRGGRLPVPAGYTVDGTGFSAQAQAGPLLSLPVPTGAMVPVLGQSRGSPLGVRILPISDASRDLGQGLFPFFFQDRSRTYFVRPVVNEGRKVIQVPVRRPLVGRAVRGAALRFGRRRGAPLRTAGRGGRQGRRGESFDLVASEWALDVELGLEPIETEPEGTLSPEELDEWEDIEDEAWHPDDAEARRAPRHRTRPPKTPRQAPRTRLAVRPQLQQVRRALHLPQLLRFVPFEHSQTCRLINTLKRDGIEALLDLNTTHGNRVALDHRMKGGKWIPRNPSRFEIAYRPGALVDKRFPRLDIDFDYDNPYALYNWELFFHAPLQVAIRLAKDGRHEEAQRWFHFIFDPTIDTSAPPPRRYWRFAPFHENTEYEDARRLMALLSYAGADAELVRRKSKVEEQVVAWLEKPFSPHTIARLRMAAYQKAVVMKYIDNLIEWGDKLFRRDTMESIQEATQLYILAGNILGQRPERIPPPVATAPVTFRQVREKLDLFSNWSVRFENAQVRRPFRIDARPDVGAATSILGMATLYFCVPPNPDLDKKWDTVSDRLFKIRNCMNISGVVRRLPLFEPPIEPGMLVRAAAAGVDLGSVISSLNAPPPAHRFRFLVQRAIGLAEQLRSFGMATLNAIERRDAERLVALRQSNETALLEAIRDVHKIKVKQVEEELAWLALQREYVDLQVQHVLAQAQELMNAQESSKQESLTASQAVSAVAEGVDLAAKVAYAIPEMQGGTAGGFSSPFITVQMGGQMFGDIASAFAESMVKIASQRHTEADMAGAQADYQRRQAELIHQGELLTKERERIQKQIAEIQLKLEISNAELKRHDTAVESSRKVSEYLREKYTSEELYGWMLGQLSASYFQAYKFAFDMAKLAERALQFERGEPAASYVEFSYWDSLKKGLLSGERLLLDIRRMDAAYLEGDRRALEVTRHLSLRDDAPTALEELLATGRCQLDISETLLDGDFPGHYFRRIRTVSMTMSGPIRPQANVNCTLTLLENRIRTSANASGSYPHAQDGDDPRFLANPVPMQAIATSRAKGDAGLFVLSFEDERFLPFEGAGAISSWRIDLHQSDNAVDLSELVDIVLSLSYSAKSGGAPLEVVARAHRDTGLARGGLVPPPQHRVSLRRDLSESWKQLQAATPGQSVELNLPLDQARFGGRFHDLKLGVEAVTAYARSRRKLDNDVLHLQIVPPAGGPVPIAGWMRPWPASQTLRAQADAKGAPGSWKLNVTARNAKVTDLLNDLVLIFDLRGRREQA